jgi:hypothetical protein
MRHRIGLAIAAAILAATAFASGASAHTYTTEWYGCTKDRTFYVVTTRWADKPFGGHYIVYQSTTYYPSKCWVA